MGLIGAPGVPISAGVATTGVIRRIPVNAQETLGGGPPNIDSPDGPLMVPPSPDGPRPPAHWAITRVYLPIAILARNPAGDTPPSIANLTLLLKSEDGAIALASFLPISLQPLAGGGGTGNSFGTAALGSDLTNPMSVWCTQSIRFEYAISFDQRLTFSLAYLGISLTMTDPTLTPPLVDLSTSGAADYETI